MSNYSSLKSAIDANIKANGRREITGPVLNAILNAVVNSLGDGYLFRGVAIPSTNPGTPDQNVAYLAITEGTYTHMGGLSVTDGELSVFSYNGAWSKIPLALVPTKTSQLDNDLRFVTSEEMGESLSSKQDTIQDLSEIRSGAALANNSDHRPYNSSNPDGMGYLVLKKNKTFAEQTTEENTIYEIRYDFELGGASVTIPAGCVLKFNGGKLSNGIIVGNSTCVESTKKVIFDSNIVIDGTWNNGVVFSEWAPLVSDNPNFDNRQMLRNIFALCKSENLSILCMQKGVFYLNAYKDNDYSGVSVFSNTYVFARDAEFRVIPNDKERYSIISIVDESNIVIDGGIYIGDVESHDGSTGEACHGFRLAEAKNICLKNLVVQKCWGDGFYITNPYSYVEQSVTGGQCENIVIQRCKSIANRRQGCSIEAAIGVLIEDCIFADTGTINGTSPMLGINIEPYAEHQVVKDITIRNCHIYGNSNPDYGISLSHGTAPEYLEDNFSIDSCVIDKGVQCKPLNGFSIQDTKMGRLQANAPSIGARSNEMFLFSVSGSNIDGNLDFRFIKSNGIIKDCLIGENNRTFILVEGASSEADIKFYNCSIITGGNTQTPYIETTADFSKVGLHFYNCEISGAILNTAQIGFRIAGDFVGNVFDVSTSGNDTAYITLSAPGKKVRIKGNNFLNVGTQKRIVYFPQTNDLSAINPLYEIEGNRFVGGTTSEKRIFFNYGGTPLKHIKSVGNFYPASAGYEAQSQVDISFTNDIFEVGGAFLLRNGSNFTNLDGTNTKKVGATADRPTASAVGAGFTYFDTDLGKMIVSNGTAWVNMDGSAL